MDFAHGRVIGEYRGTSVEEVGLDDTITKKDVVTLFIPNGSDIIEFHSKLFNKKVGEVSVDEFKDMLDGKM